jgi:hypothetical protein
MKQLLHCRAMESMCRRRAAADAVHREDWLRQAEDWQDLAVREIALHFRECNASDRIGPEQALIA